MSEFAVPKIRQTKLLPKKRRLKELNEELICSLCQGYLIDATTISDCIHSFCRSCIVKHLQIAKCCPKCKSSNKHVQLTQLRPDKQLQSVVYKLVSGLYHSEQQRKDKFNEEHKITVPIAATKPASHLNSKFKFNQQIDPFQSNIIQQQQQSQEEQQQQQQQQQPPIPSSSTADDVTWSGGITEEIIDDVVEFYSPDDPISLSLEYHPNSLIDIEKLSTPQIRYLQCPAAVTVRHLQRFLSSKYNLNLDSPIVDIKIIYDDEVLPTGFSLMDIAYCFEWKRVTPLQLYYQIFINPVEVIDDRILSSTEVNSNDNDLPSHPHQHHSQHRHHHHHHHHHYNNGKAQRSQQETDTKIAKDKEMTMATPTSYSNVGKNSNSQNNNNNNNDANNDTNSNTNSDKNVQNTKMSSPKAVKPTTKPVSDFKSLRSNDIKFNNYVEVKNDRSKASKTGGTVPHSDSKPQQKYNKPNSIKEPKQQKVSPSSSDSSDDVFFASLKKTKTYGGDSTVHTLSSDESHSDKSERDGEKQNFTGLKPEPRISSNIVVSIPQSRRSSFSDDSFENMSLAMLKTAKQKSKSSLIYKQSVSVDDSMLSKANPKQQDIPKLKIELSSLKTKFSVPKPRLLNRESRLSVDDRSMLYNFSQQHHEVDVNEYAKNIGLKPIYRSQSDRTESESSHKKRKKNGKHSKEPGSKRRKLHAEISSQEEESLKLKLKLTANKPSKHERKSSSGTAEHFTSPKVSKREPVEPTEQRNIDVPTKEKILELRQVRHKPSTSVSPPERKPDAIADTVPKPVSIVSSQPSTSKLAAKPIQSAVVFSAPSTSSLSSSKQPQSVPDLKAKSFTVVPQQKPKALPEIRPLNIPGRMFSPPPVPNYPSLSFTSTRPTTSMQSNGRQPSVRPILKRSSGDEGFQMSKQVRFDSLAHRKMAPGLIPTTSIRPQHRPVTSSSPKTETYYNSTMSSSYTHEITTKKPVPMLLPPSSISVTKMTDMPKSIQTGSNINSRPALEIVRISSSAPTIDQQHMKQVHAVKQQQSIKVPRPLPQTIPLVKIKKAANSIMTTASMQSLNNTPIYSRSSSLGADLPSSSNRKNDAFSPGHSKKCPLPEPTVILDLSGKDSPPLEKNSEISSSIIIDITSSNSADEMPQTGEPTTANKPDQNKNSNRDKIGFISKASSSKTASSNIEKNANGNEMSASSNNLLNSNEMSMTNKNSNERRDRKTPDETAKTSLQNLQLLSDSALNREKMLPSSPPIPSPTTSTILSPRPLPLPKLNEINKLRTSATVRQQSASVRNIPNPSALAFRNQTVPQKSYGKASSSTSTLATTVSMLASKAGNASMQSVSTVPMNSARPTQTPSVSSSSNLPALASPKRSSLSSNVSSTSSTTNTQSVSTTSSKASNTPPPPPRVVPTPSNTTPHSPSSSTPSTSISSSSSSIGATITNTTTNATISSSSSSNSSTISTSIPASTTIAAALTPSTTTTTKLPSPINNNDVNDAKLIAAKKNLHIEKLAANLRAAAANSDLKLSGGATTVA